MSKFPPLALTILLGLLMWFADRLLPVPLDVPGNTFLALATAAVGTTLIVLAIITFRRAATTLDPRVPEESSALVTQGVFRFSRNPIYLGFALWLLGWGIHLESIAALTGVPVFVLWMDRVQVPAEEHALREHFGEAFAHYCDRVRRWL